MSNNPVEGAATTPVDPNAVPAAPTPPPANVNAALTSTGGFITSDPNLSGEGSPVVSTSTGGLITGDPNLNGDGSPLPAATVVPQPFSSTNNPELNGSAGAQTALDSTGLTTVTGGNPELNGGGSPSAGAAGNIIPAAVTSLPASTTLAPASDLRVRLSALNPNDIYAGPKNANSILAILANTGGMIFPYTPQISFSQQVNYTDLQLVHSNTDYPAYTRTPSVTISVTGKFTVQNQREGQYAMAAIHFLRAVSKSYFGEIDALAGTAGLPPPVLVFSGYGPYMFSNVRVILKNHSWAFDENMDTVSVLITGSQGQKTVRLPAMFSLQVELQVVQTPNRMLTKFSFEAFANGDLLTDGFI